MHRFAYAANSGNKLNVKSPYATTGEGLISLDPVWDNYEFSLGFRVLFDDVTTTGYLFHNTEQASSKNENYQIYVNSGKMYWNDPASGAVRILSKLTTGILYSVWLDIYETSIDVHCNSSAGETITNVVKNAYYPTSSYMCLYNERTGNNQLLGTMFDLVMIGGLGSCYELYKVGGVTWNDATMYWTMREGTGSTITDKIGKSSQIYTGHFSGIGWRTVTQDNAKKWS